MKLIQNKTLLVLLYAQFLSGLFFSCSQRSKEHSLENIAIANYLKILAPENSKLVPEKSIDNYSAKLIVNTDTFDVELGTQGQINDLYSIGPEVWDISEKDSLFLNKGILPGKDELIFSKTPEMDRVLNIYDKQMYYYDTCNGIIMRIIQPKRVGNGITGAYVAELKNGRSFCIYSKGLKDESQRNAILMFKTIQYLVDSLPK